MSDGTVPWKTFDEVVRQALVNREKLDRIAALDQHEANVYGYDEHGDSLVSMGDVRSILRGDKAPS